MKWMIIPFTKKGKSWDIIFEEKWECQNQVYFGHVKYEMSIRYASGGV